MSEPAGADIVIDELVLDGVDPAAVPVLLRAIEDAVATSPTADAEELAAAVSGGLHKALHTGGWQ